MKMKLACTWRQALSTRINVDQVRRTASQFRGKRLTCLLPKSKEDNVEILKNWLHENQIVQFTMATVYDVKPESVYYHGLAFEFINDSDAILFKLRFM
jgi:hypothetical protein